VIVALEALIGSAGASAPFLSIAALVLAPGLALAPLLPARVRESPLSVLTAAPVLGTNWNYNANFGTPKNRFAFTSPRAFRVTFGVRF